MVKLTIFFINAPTQITHQALPLIKERKFKNLTVVVPEELVTTFKNMNIKTIVPDVNPNLITNKDKWHLISNIIKANKEYKKYFEGIKGQTIYLFFSSWAVVFLSYVAKLSKDNKVILLRMDNSDEQPIIKYKGIKAFVMKQIARHFLKVETEIVCKLKEKTPVYKLNRNSIPLKIVKYDKFDGEFPDILKENPIVRNKKILFLSSELKSEGANMKDIENITNYLYDIFEKDYPDKYVIKGHPKNSIIYANMKKSKHIISHTILLETLFGHDWDFIISYYSEGLVSAKLRTTAKVISLIHLWKWSDNIGKEIAEKRQKKVGVLMPKTLNELKELLK